MMNNIYKLSLLGIFCFSSFMVKISAQGIKKDTLLNRQVYLEREYTPTIQDASKVNSLPALRKPQRMKHDIKFEESIPKLNLTQFPIRNNGSGDILTDIYYSKHKGYFTFGAGTHTNLEGSLGYRLIDSRKDQLNIFASHNSTNGNIKYLEKSPTYDKVKAKDMENLIKLRYSHQFDPVTWYISGSFFNDTYNYYGFPYLDMARSQIDNIAKDKQSINVINVETGIQSNQQEQYSYAGKINYHRLTSKYGPSVSYDGISANIVDADANVMFPIISSFKLGARGGAFYQKIDKVKFPTTDGAFHSLIIFKANPYINIENDNISLSLGVALHQAIDYNDKTQIAPTLNLDWNFQEKSMLYLSIDGGLNSNSLISIIRENKYIDLSQRVDVSKTVYNGQLGIRSGIIEGLEFDLFGGYKYVKDQYLYTPAYTSSWINVSKPMYGNLKSGHFGAGLKTKLLPYTDLSFKAIGYFYDLKEYTKSNTNLDHKEAWGLPNLTFNFNADFSFIENLILTANYNFEGGRKTYLKTSSIKMKAINELNFKANYQISDWLSVYAKANNVLNQKYERYYGYTLQGINVVGGINIKF